MANLERPLRGFEKFCAIPNNRTIVAHWYPLRGDIEHIINNALDGIAYLHERHPILRAKLVFPEGTEEIRIQCRETPLPKEKLASTLKVITDCKPLFWQEHIANIGNQFIDPTCSSETSPFEFHILRTEGDPQHAYFIIFSDHSFSDGFSGFRLIYDFLSFVFEKKKFPNMPLPPSAVDLISSHPQFLKGFLRMLKPILHKRSFGICTNFPIPDYVPEVKDHLVQYPKYFSFRNISNEKYQLINETCKAKGVTLLGPFLATMFAALSRVGPQPAGPHSSFNRLVDFDINVRKRCKPPLGDDSIANLVSLASIGSLLSGKFNTSLHANFWKLANHFKKKAHAIANISASLLSVPIYFDIMASSESVMVDYLRKSKKVIIGDINLSNMGRFPFPSTYARENVDHCKVEIENVGFCSSVPAVGNAVLIFACAQKTLTFTMTHRTDVEVAEKFFTEWIKLVEEIPSIQKSETLGQLISRILN